MVLSVYQIISRNDNLLQLAGERHCRCNTHTHTHIQYLLGVVLVYTDDTWCKHIILQACILYRIVSYRMNSHAVRFCFVSHVYYPSHPSLIGSKKAPDPFFVSLQATKSCLSFWKPKTKGPGDDGTANVHSSVVTNPTKLVYATVLSEGG